MKTTAYSQSRLSGFLYSMLAILIFALSLACDTPKPKASEEQKPVVQEVKETATGMASFYGPGLEGRKTSGGETFDSDEMVAAHPSYPLGTIVRVTNLSTQDTVRVRIADRGPTSRNRKEGIIIDISRGAAAKLKMIEAGRQKVQVDVLEWGIQDNAKDSIPH